MEAQKVFNDTFNDLIKGDLSIDNKKISGIARAYILKSRFFSRSRYIYMLPSNLILAIEKKEGYNNKILVSNTDMKIGSNRDINKDRKKLSVAKPVARHDPLE